MLNNIFKKLLVLIKILKKNGFNYLFIFTLDVYKNLLNLKPLLDSIDFYKHPSLRFLNNLNKLKFTCYSHMDELLIYPLYTEV